MQKNLLKILWFYLLPLSLLAQAPNLSNHAVQRLAIQENPIQVDSLTIIPATVEIFWQDALIDSTNFRFTNNHLLLSSRFLEGKTSQDSITIHYRVFPFDLQAVYNHLDSTQNQVDEKGNAIGLIYDPYATRESGAIEFQGLDYNGTFARGISFGNNQNLVLNSSFNLQLAGNVGDGVEILAAISDNNIPLQPEGNTQQLNEFDKIFIQLTKDKHQLIAGDYELGVRPPASYFMNYFKKLQGATYKNTTEVLDGKGELQSQASIAISRGRTARNVFNGQEGNQGPYRLEGSEGERFIIILAGTERVFIDGKLMKRGIEEDYVIDYNAGDITFTQRRLISKDSRIIIEFEYSVDNYTRSMYAANLNYQQGEKLRLYLNVFSEQDGKQPVDDDFSEEEFNRLVNAGDDPFLATISGIDTIESFSAFRILYKLVPNPDSVCTGEAQKLEFTTNPDSALYVGRFSLVAPGEGFYDIDNEVIANGTVYKYVGCGQGSYIPFIQIVTPKQQQIYTFGGHYDFTENNRLKTEIALSTFDQNRLSPINDNDNLGIAAFTQLENDFELGKKRDWRLETEATYEFKQDRFEFFNPYRPAEFVRDWNINSTEQITEHIGVGSLQLKSKKYGTLEHQFTGFWRDSLYTGTKQVTRYSYTKKNGLKINLENNILNTEGLREQTQFFRPKFDITMPFLADSTGQNPWQIGIAGEREKNQRFNRVIDNNFSDTLSQTSFFFDVVNAFVENSQVGKWYFRGGFRQRRDYAPVEDSFETSSVGSEFNLQSRLKNRRKDKNNRRFSSNLDLNFTYRTLSIKDTLLTIEEAAQTYLGRINYNWNLFDGAIQSNSSYEIKSGQERKTEFIYEEVEAGLGTFLWEDDNGDNIVQETEVRIAPFQDLANVVRFVRFTDEFIRTNNVTLNQVLRLEPKAVWFRAEKGVKQFLTKFSTQSSLQITRKVRDLPNVNPWNPFDLEITDTSLVATNSNIRNTLFFNRGNQKFDVQLGASNVVNKQFLSSGFDSRQNAKQFLKGRWNISPSFSIISEFSLEKRQRDNEGSESDSYNIEGQQLDANLTWLSPEKNFRSILTYRFENSENTLIEDGETSQEQELKLSTKYNQSSKTSLEAEFSYVKVNFDGAANSAVGFAFLNGLQDGNNFLWNLTLDRRVAKNIQLRVSYEGRKTGMSRVIHVGSAQMAATF